MTDKANFFKDDPELKRQLGELDGVTSKAGFSNWKNSFVKVVQTFLDTVGTAKAQAAYAEFTQQIKAMLKAKSKLDACLENQSLSKEKCSVKARRCLAEMQAELQKISATLERLLPGNASSKVGYTNYHMGAMLISEGFTSYTTLTDCDVALVQMVEDALQYVADKQLLAEIENYRDKLKMFCAIMADLGIFIIAKKALEVSKLEEVFVEDEATAVDLTKPAAPAAEPAPAQEEAPAAQKELTPAPTKPATPVPRSVTPPPPAKEEPAPIPATKATPAAAPPSPKEEPVPEEEEEQVEIAEQRRRQTITITATHSAPKPVVEDDAKKKKVRTAPPKRKKGDQPDDLPRTAKPKAPARIPGNGGGGGGPRGRGRGVGRTLSKDEAKEVLPPMKKAPEPRIRKPPKKKDEEEKEEEEQEDDDDDDDDEEEKKEKPKKQPPKKPAAPPADGNKGPAAKQPAAAAAGAKKPQAKGAAPKKAAAPAAPINNKVPVIVHKADGTTVKLMVDLTKDKLGLLKKQLEKKTGMPVDQQRISIKYINKELEAEEKSLGFYGVKENTDLDLDPLWILVHVKMAEDGKEHALKKISPAMYTVNNVKGKIEREMGLSADRQLLKFKGAVLADGKKTIKECGIVDGDTITVEVSIKVPITVHTVDGKQIKLMMDLSRDKLADMRQQLEKDARIKADNQRLFMKSNGKEIVEDNNELLEDTDVEEGSELLVEPRHIHVIVQMPSGKSHKLQVTLDYNMSDMIRAMVEKETAKDCVTEQDLQFDGKELQKGQTVREMGLKEGSKVKLELKK